MIAALLDTETTGLPDPEHRIIEIYLELVDTQTRRTLFTMNQRINPKRSIPADAQRVHKIAVTDLLDKPDWEKVGPVVHKALSKARVMVAHNAEFDASFLSMECARIGLPPIAAKPFCTMENGRWATPIGKQPSLKELCWACEVPYDDTQAHAADYDVIAMKECLWRGMDWGFFDIERVVSDPAHSHPPVAA